MTTLGGMTIYRVSPDNCEGCRPGWLPRFQTYILDLCERHETQLREYVQEFGTVGVPRIETYPVTRVAITDDDGTEHVVYEADR